MSRYADGDFVALVSEKQGEQLLTRGQFQLDMSPKSGEFVVWGFGGAVEHGQTFDFTNRPGYEGIEDLLAQHHVKSVGLWTLLLWEDYLADTAELAGLGGWSEGPVCPGCSSTPSGCSPGWLVPDSCAWSSIASACSAHDDCYQCGMFCSGTSRARCDRNFRQAVYQATGSYLCAWIYYLGVRGLGWMFYQDPDLRPNMGDDVYYLGIQLTACEGQYYGMCTIYVF